MALMAPGARIPDNGKEAAEVPRPTSQHEERYGAGGSSQDLIRESATRHPDPVEHEAAEVRRPTSQHEERYGAGGSSQDLIRESATRHQDPVERKYPGATGSPGTVSAFAVPDRGSTLEGILGRFLEVPGVGAVAFFREGSIVASLGDRALEDLVEPAEEVLLSAFEVLPLLSSGSLVQVTVQLFGHNITITPYNDGYLLIQTYPEINLGQIRKLAQCINREPGYGMG
jgi:predicted regulator of Ras-like GTPase activity (Roadblock/LC7/MglB family)